jgi:alpha-beta hydrolase superfamily lysophospholipase
MRPLTSLMLVAAAAALGCSYPPALPLRMPEAAAEAQAGVTHKDGSFVGVRGTQLYEQSWRPAGEARAVVVVVHGLKDHSANYRALAVRLAQQGFAVHAFDLRGHGRSEGIRVWAESFDDYLGDLEIFMAKVRAEEASHDGGNPQTPGRPFLLFGHSMGGAIATLYTITRHPDLKGLALSGAALSAGVPAVKIGGTKLVAALSPGAGVFDLDLHQFSRDPAVVQAGLADPLVYQGAASARTARELLSAIAQIQDHMEEVTVPLLVMHGAADTVTPPSGSKALVDRARSTDKTLKVYPGMYHDLLHEPEKEQVTADLVKWLVDHAPIAMGDPQRVPQTPPGVSVPAAPPEAPKP